MWRRRKPDAGPSKTAGAVAAAVTTGTEARLAWIRRRCRYRPLNPGVRMHERACVDGCRPSGSSGNGYQPEAARLPGIAPNRSEEHKSELQSLMRTSYAVLCVKH